VAPKQNRIEVITPEFSLETEVGFSVSIQQRIQASLEKPALRLLPG